LKTYPLRSRIYPEPGHRVTKEQLELFQWLRAADATDQPRGNEFFEKAVQLHRLLGRRPWHYDTMDAANPDPPSDLRPHEIPDYHIAHQLYCALEAAAK
jgi:hypothetical protein